ncbi:MULTISPECIES: hypothetical protein [Actinoalloteichus]|uniref:Carrier domain-containing protein n=1 Tax=Actinoalloteichus fjordicus TaxID=1612552 RepID=A0AAC9LHE6_9PSEU|nr:MULTISPECIES: hypothetical protein [Actinoalloteichus]APU16390.1 hypothetical protein UA74_21840 [Actinoalloteichus fjordicus]APU22448.1 hypothetical protein UA75_22310 [Actinoalloteichus sp. GBA129-24]
MTGHLAVDADQVLAEVISGIIQACPRIDPEIDEITMTTDLREDLALSSVDLVTVFARLTTVYETRVNFVDLVVEGRLADTSALTVGSLVEYIVRRLAAAAT